jgi:hypothetical protein
MMMEKREKHEKPLSTLSIRSPLQEPVNLSTTSLKIESQVQSSHRRAHKSRAQGHGEGGTRRKCESPCLRALDVGSLCSVRKEDLCSALTSS